MGHMAKCIKIYGREPNNKATMPVKNNLFDDDSKDKAVILGELEADKFHHAIAKLLHLSKKYK